MSCIEHNCRKCGELWFNNVVFQGCPACGTFNQGIHDEPNLDRYYDNYSRDEDDSDNIFRGED